MESLVDECDGAVRDRVDTPLVSMGKRSLFTVYVGQVDSLFNVSVGQVDRASYTAACTLVVSV